MPQENLQKLYDTVSQTHDIGDYETFAKKMQNGDSRKKFYGAMSDTYDLGDFQTFESKVQLGPGLLEAVGKRVAPNPESPLYTQIPTPFGNLNLQQIADAYGVSESAIASLLPNKSGEKAGQEETAAQAIERGKVIGEALTPTQREELGYVLSAGSSIGAPSQKEAQDIGAVGASLIGDPLNLVFAAEGVLKLIKLGKVAEATKGIEELTKGLDTANIDDVVKTLGKTPEESTLKTILTDIKEGKTPEMIIEETAKKNIDVGRLPEVKGKRTVTAPEDLEKAKVNPEALPDVTQQPKTRKVVPIQKGQEPLPQEVTVGKTSQRRVGSVKQEGQTPKPKAEVKKSSGAAAETGGVVQEAQPIRAYHGTKFRGTANELKDTGRGGVHFGTKEAAETFTKREGQVIPVDLDIKNPLRINDVRTNDSWHQIGEVERKFGIDIKNYSQMVKEMEKRGYDGFVYKNKFEDVGQDSFVPLRQSQIKPIKKIEPSPEALSGKEYGKGLVEAVKKDITSKASGITPDPYRNIKQFLTENKLELTDKEIETLQQFAKKTLRETGTAAEKQQAIERYAQHTIEARMRAKAPPPTEQEVNATVKEVIQPQAEKAATETEQALTETQQRHQNITKILNEEVKPLNKEQAAIYRKEKAQRFAKMRGVGERVKGEAGAYAQRSQMAGEYTKVEIESLRNRLPQEEIDKLFDDLKTLNQGDHLTAINGMERILNGKVPRPSEVKVLESVYGKELTDALIGNVPLFKRAIDLGLEILNVPRSLMASFDLSAPFRQGLWAGTRHPVIFAKNFRPMIKSFASEKNYQALLAEIHSRPTYKLMEKHKLAITELGKMSEREERFMSNLAEKIPIAGRVVRASGRAYTGFLDKFRADLFDYMVKYGEKFGVADDPAFLTDAAKFINRATGRGGLGYFERAAVPLNATIFSPRLMTSRLQLTLSPAYYIKMNPVVRREALKNLFTMAGMAMTVAGVGKLAGADVEPDPRNANFMKLRFGNTRYDFLGGFQQPIRAAAQMLSGKVISSTTGKEITLGEGYKPLTRFDIAQRYIEMKESPVASLVTGLLRGRNSIGEKLDVPTEVMNRFLPMVAQDMADIYREKGPVGIPMGLPAIFGLGSQTYGGLQVWGLDNKDYPELNKELDRLKISAGFPSTTAFGVELNMKEYKQFKKEAGKAIAKDLESFIVSPAYEGSPDDRKKEMIESRIDYIKEQTRYKLFQDKEKQKYYEEREKVRRIKSQ